VTTTRTRFAPSPTGFLHLGNVRTALFAFLFARKTKGQFVLRIEDTDQERLAEGSEAAIYEDLKWLGLNWDEGPDTGGPLGPYKCSQRYEIYELQLKRLLKLGKVYRCFCSPDQLDQDRKLLSSQKKILKYVGRCRSISPTDSEQRAKSEPFVWRMKVEEGPGVKINDLVRGEVEMSREILGDFVLARSTGIPVFLFQNTIDDALQEMTHVIRGEDHLSNTFRQVLIYEALEFTPPAFAHLPMIGDEDGGKLSKRAGSLSIRQLRADGYLPVAITNYMALLGWSPGDTSKTGEKFSLTELQELFDVSRIHKGRALFDFQKLQFLNHAHIQDLTTDQIVALVPCRNQEWSNLWPAALELVKHDCSTLADFYKIEAYLKKPVIDSEASQAMLRKPSSQEALTKVATILSASAEPAVEVALKAAIQETGKALGLKGKDLFFPFRVALTGSETGPELMPLAKILGRQEVLERLDQAIAVSKAS
jgi:glutamyl-tRNA synthetase